MSFFGVNVNPFSTPVGQKIEQATDSNLPSENWALNMEICDIINETEDGPRDALKAIKRRLNQAAGKNYTVVLYTLTVLETCVKNCGKRFHSLVCSREFVLELVKMIGPKNEPPTAVQEKVLSLIQTWADTFRHQPYTQGVVQVYQELKAKGMQFPMTDLDAMAPIITPERSVPEVTCPVHTQGNERNIACDTSAVAAAAAAAANVQQIQSSAMRQPVQLSDNLTAKIKNELEIVQGNMRVLGEMINYFTNQDKTQVKKTPNDPDAADFELMEHLYTTCKAMQERVVDLIGRLIGDEMTAELLRINDEFNNLFLRYSRYTKNKDVTSASAILAQTIAQPPNSDIDTIKKQSEPSLIDLDEDSVHSIDNLLTNLDVSNKATRSNNQSDQPDNDEFDMFAQSRNATYDTTKNTGSRYEDNIEELSGGLNTAILSRGTAAGAVATSAQTATGVVKTTVPLQESEINEMAEWLGSTSAKEPGDQESLTSSEFERFLAERAAAAEALPNLPAVTTSPSTIATATSTSTPSTNIPRQINKDQDKSLFAL